MHAEATSINRHNPPPHHFLNLALFLNQCSWGEHEFLLCASKSLPELWGILVSATSISLLHKNRNMLDAVMRWRGLSFPCSALIDSGAEGNFIDESWAIEHGIPLHKLSDPPTAFDGRVLSNIHRATVAVSLSISGNHQETFFSFFFFIPL